MKYRSISLLLLVLCTACGASDEASTPMGESSAVTQGGPQDIAQFRAVVATGDVPSIDLLDEVGFFAEHAMDLPAAECGASVCPHGMLAVAPRFDESNWTMAFVALNSAVQASDIAARPRHLVWVVENSPRTETWLRGSAIVDTLIAALGPDDRASIVTLTTPIEILADAVTPTQLAELRQQGALAFPSYPFANVDLFAGLARTLSLTQHQDVSDLQQNVAVFSSGVTDAGVTEIAHFTDLAREFATQGVVLSSFGIGQDYQRTIPMQLAEVGSGNYYYATNVTDLEQAVEVEAATAFAPIARTMRLSVSPQTGYRVGRVYGARTITQDGNTVVIETPTLFLGSRSGSQDTAMGRRGGGGGLFVQLIADEASVGVGAADAFSMTLSYDDVLQGEAKEFSETWATPMGIGVNPPPDAPFFSDVPRAKPFMMLNMYLALYAMIELYEAGDCGGAQGIRDMMFQSYTYWSEIYADPDIDADYELLTDLSQNIRTFCNAPVSPRPAAHISCFMF
jgi:Ca-activated chloride channel family protein